MKHYLHTSLRALFLSLVVLMSLPMLAEEVEIDGFVYELNSETKQATVLSKNKGGSNGYFTIPASVEYMGSTYSVVSIGKDAFKQSYNLYSVTIPNSVIVIEEGAFYGCPYLNSVIIPNSLIEIGDEAFYNCAFLHSIDLPNSVVSIGSSAFYGCKSLSSVTIPNSVASIGYMTFSGCTEMRTVIIGEGVTNIGYRAFSDCNNLRNVFCMSENVPSKYFSFDSHCVASATLHVPELSVDSYTSSWGEFGTIVAISSSDEQVEIGGIKYKLAVNTKQATVIAKNDDGYSGEITIPESVEYKGSDYSVTTIADNAFCYCSDLTSVAIPNSVTYIGDYAFSSSGLKSVTIPNSITNIGRETFAYCTNLTSVSIPNGVTSIGFQAFRGCESLASFAIPNSVTHIGSWALGDCKAITSIIIPKSVTSLGYGAISACPNLTEIRVDEGNTKYDSQENCNAIIETSSNTLISGCQTTVIPNSVTSIGYAAFSKCHNLTSITIPEGVTRIDMVAFGNCMNLNCVVIPSSVVSIGAQAFSGCRVSVHISDIAAWCNIIFDASARPFLYDLYLNGEVVKDLVIPAGVTSIGCSSFWGANLTSVTIPNSVTSIGSWSFHDCTSLTDVYCYAENVPFTHAEAFSGSLISTATLYVPKTSVEQYSSAAPWSKFGTIKGFADSYQLTISSVGYATLFLDYNAQIPEGVEAYVATEVVDGRLKMKKVEGVLPANTGVIAKADAGTYTFVDSDETPATIEKNLFKGSVANEEITAKTGFTYYVLSAPNGNVGMYRAKIADGKFLNNANRAYLSVQIGDLGVFDEEVDSETEQLSRRLVFDFGDETGIDEVKTENGELKTAIFDLSGRRVQKAQKGIYIQNGKVVVK